jgi:tetratricopeptide (TPR) repeat protein
VLISALIGTVSLQYEKQGNFEKAAHYTEEWMPFMQQAPQAYPLIAKEIGLSQADFGNALNRVGILYKKQGKWEKALYYYKQALELGEECQLTKVIALSLNNIENLSLYRLDCGNIRGFQEQNEVLEQALRDAKHALALREQLHNLDDVADSQGLLALLYVSQATIWIGQLFMKSKDDSTENLTAEDVETTYREKIDQARNYLEQSRSHWEHVGNFSRERLLLSSFAVSHIRFSEVSEPCNKCSLREEAWAKTSYNRTQVPLHHKV